MLSFTRCLTLFLSPYPALKRWAIVVDTTSPSIPVLHFKIFRISAVGSCLTKSLKLSSCGGFGFLLQIVFTKPNRLVRPVHTSPNG
jgi:hypothetical protein